MKNLQNNVLTLSLISTKLETYYNCLLHPKSLIADSAPGIVDADLYSALIFCAIHQPDISICAVPLRSQQVCNSVKVVSIVLLISLFQTVICGNKCKCSQPQTNLDRQLQHLGRHYCILSALRLYHIQVVFLLLHYNLHHSRDVVQFLHQMLLP